MGNEPFELTVDGIRTQLWQYNVINALSFTILIFDYFLTLDAEIVRFWQRKSKIVLPGGLFFANRYISLFGNIPIVVMYFWYSPASAKKTAVRSAAIFCLLETPSRSSALCHNLETYHEFFLCVTQFIVALILVIRTFALYGRTKRVLISLGTLIAITAALVLFGIFTSLHASDKVGSESIFLGCISPKGHIQSRGFIIAWSTLAVFDTIIFGMSMWWTLREGFWSLTVSPQLKGLYAVRIFLRDGAIYYIVIILINLANISTFGLNNSYARGMLSVLANIISSIMISRLMLNLRDPALNAVSVNTIGMSNANANTTPRSPTTGRTNTGTGASPRDRDASAGLRTEVSGLVWAHNTKSEQDSTFGASTGTEDADADADLDLKKPARKGTDDTVVDIGPGQHISKLEEILQGNSSIHTNIPSANTHPRTLDKATLPNPHTLSLSPLRRSACRASATRPRTSRVRARKWAESIVDSLNGCGVVGVRRDEDDGAATPAEQRLPAVVDA
uniref:DUF6533 domain-containing protein n=1 Tax=Mycena chlorophos TaxID=658473 RepID=A0ABQ0MDH5_MYCCL|nr:predicted protein [Mycena chlorophos]